MTGYLFQSRYALLRALEEAKSNASLSVSIEQLDDVSFDDSGRTTELIQTKHHVSPGNVTDKSPDIWKTLRIWIDFVADNPSSAFDTRLVFITTETASENSALAKLRPSKDTRSVAGALELFTSAAKASENQSTEIARTAFLAMPIIERELLLNNIWVFDAAPNIHDVRDEIENQLFYSAPHGQVSTFTDYLEGWWFGRVILALSGEDNASIPLTAVQNKIHELREGFTSSRLPLDDQIDTMPEATSLPDDDRALVRQMRIISLNEAESLSALHDYYRAFEQRSRWARESLLLDGEADRYDRALRDAWHRQFLAAKARLATDCSDQDRESTGKEIFRWARQYQKPLRNRDELWLSAGSFQMLADALKLGWHPNYEEFFTPAEADT